MLHPLHLHRQLLGVMLQMQMEPLFLLEASNGAQPQTQQQVSQLAQVPEFSQRVLVVYLQVRYIIIGHGPLIAQERLMEQ